MAAFGSEPVNQTVDGEFKRESNCFLAVSPSLQSYQQVPGEVLVSGNVIGRCFLWQVCLLLIRAHLSAGPPWSREEGTDQIWVQVQTDLLKACYNMSTLKLTPSLIYIWKSQKYQPILVLGSNQTDFLSGFLSESSTVSNLWGSLSQNKQKA